MLKLLIGIVFALLALVWTGGAWLGSQALQWAAGAMASGQAAEMSQVVGSWPIPAWLTQWVEPSAIHAALDSVVWAMETLQQAWPFVGNAMNWLVPLLWVVWAIGFAVLLLLTAVALFAVRRLGSRPPGPPVAGAPRPASS